MSAESTVAEAAFAQLEQLYAELPAMKERGAALARARAAAAVEDLASSARFRAAELAAADAEVAAALAALDAAEAGPGTTPHADLNDRRAALLAAGTQRGLRVGPAQNAEHALERALAESPFGSIEEARAALLPAAALDALAQEVASYQRRYAEALALCQQLDDNAAT